MIAPYEPSESLDERLGYSFKNPELRDLALTHPSTFTYGQTNTDYERLEFLGDAVLELTVTEFLYHKLPQASEGLMTQLRSRVVSRPSLAKTARALGLPAYLRLGKGEDSTGGRDRDSNLSNTFEALLGSIFLDSHFEMAKKVTLALLHDSLNEVAQNPKEYNPKGELQSELQKIVPETPIYQTLENESRQPARFTARVFWRDLELGIGHGESKRKAEIAAADHALGLKVWKKKSC